MARVLCAILGNLAVYCCHCYLPQVASAEEEPKGGNRRSEAGQQFGAMHCPHIIEKVTGKREKDRKKIRATAKVHLKSHNLMADR